jgi:hypothetical protein
VRDNDDMLVGVARALFFGLEIVGGIPGVVGCWAGELVRHGARRIGAKRLDGHGFFFYCIAVCFEVRYNVFPADLP